MSKKKKKPYDPAAAARHRQERAESQAEIGRLRAQPSTAVNVDKRTGRLTGAWRLNCFNTLLPAESPERGAVDWLDELVRSANGENGQERRPDYIRASNDGPPGQNVTDAMIEASRKLKIVTDSLSPSHARMLLDLMKPDAGLITRWRGVVERCTGETNAQAQGAVVRAACVQLGWVQKNLRRLERINHSAKSAA